MADDFAPYSFINNAYELDPQDIVINEKEDKIEEKKDWTEKNGLKAPPHIFPPKSPHPAPTEEQLKAECAKSNVEKYTGKGGAVPMSEVFRYADSRDIFFMILGGVAAAIHGALYVLVTVLLGLQMDTFINYDRSEWYLNAYNDSITSESRKLGVNLTKAMIYQNRSLINLLGQNSSLPYLNSCLVNDIDNNGVLKEMRGYTWWYLGFAGLVLICAFLQITLWVVSAERQVRRIRTLFLKAVLRQEVGWYDQLGVGELNTRMSDDMYKIIDGIGDKFATFIQMFSCFIVSFVTGFVTGWKLSLVMLAIVPALIGAALVASKLNASLTAKELKAYAKAGKVAEEVLGSIRTVAAFGGEKKESIRYTNNLYDARKKGIRKGFILGIGMGIAWLILYSSYALGFWFGSRLVVNEGPKCPQNGTVNINSTHPSLYEPIKGNYTAGRLLIVFFSIVTGAIAIGQAGPNIQAISTARGACHLIFSIIDRTPKIDSASTEGKKPSSLTGNISFKNVWFRYPTRPDVPVLQGMTLDVKVGQTVALVGSSGCGKSTSVQLIQRFYDPLFGSIEIDGNDIKELNLKWLREQIGIVSQEPILFGTTIKENIRYGREGVSDSDIEKAAKNANAFNFIDKLPEKFDTLVGERGTQLSGGQKQRIAIARALVRNPKILLLDEATSALDTESEATVQNALDKARQGRTTLVIAHRLSTVRNADIICGFRQGVLVEMGCHEDLMLNEGGVYYQLVTMQSRQAALDAEAAKSTDNAIEADIVPPDPDAIPEVEKLVKADDPEEENFAEKLSGSLRGSLRALKRVGAGFGFSGPSIGRLHHNEEQDEINMAKKLAFEEEVTKPAPVSKIVAMNKKEWVYILFGCLACIINGSENPVFAVVFTTLLAAFIEIEPDLQKSQSERYSLAFVGMGGALIISQFLMNYMFANSGERLTMRLRKLTFKSMLRQNIAWFDDHKNNVGALCTRLARDASSVQGATGSRVGLILQNFSNIGIGIILAFVLNWRLTLVMCAFLPLIVITGVLETRVLTGVAANDKKELEKAGKVALEAVENIRTVASLTKENKFYSMYNDMLQIPYKNSLKKAWVFGLSFAISQSIVYIIFGVAFLFGAFLIQRGHADFNRVFAVVSVVIFGAMGIGQAIAFAPDYTKARVAAARLFHLFDRVPPIDIYSPKGKILPNFDGRVRFEEVRFRYPTRPEIPILQGLNLKVIPGQTLALVGSSGCGKSTTVSLIERFYDSLTGTCLVDGVNIKDLNLDWFRRQCGIVSQEPILFDASIAENIAYGDNSRKVTIDEVITAAKNSNIHSFISSLPNGYDTNVGDRGTQLSGGQKQRVAIARALVRKPKILLLDEATSALDTESEKIVQEALDQARAGRTCIVIAHRLSTIQDADAIAVFHKGRVCELGKHSELLEKKGIYWNLQQVQAGAGKN
ncbi:DgyrCDS6378 [Dimorphilus gyrociliatus]|uniref:DgyrCDS6378 n=1 Tax=Dimorphilus gyrociliatus TaxID=2664684 RepID=A0A7I8VPG4_9ANNE|nr:DgyrCDS6378 [Dimorphilus gyrociliatus]